MSTTAEKIGFQMNDRDAIALALAVMGADIHREQAPPDGVVTDAGHEAEPYLEWVTRFA